MKRKHEASSKLCSVACVSLNLMPSRYSTDWLYARMSALSARILNICSVVTSVQRPCLMMWQTGTLHATCKTDGLQDIKYTKVSKVDFPLYCLNYYQSFTYYLIFLPTT